MKLRKGDLMLPLPSGGCQFDYQILYVQRCSQGEVWTRDLYGEQKCEMFTIEFLDRWYMKIDRQTAHLFELLFQ